MSENGEKYWSVQDDDSNVFVCSQTKDTPLTVTEEQRNQKIKSHLKHYDVADDENFFIMLL